MPPSSHQKSSPLRSILPLRLTPILFFVKTLSYDVLNSPGLQLGTWSLGSSQAKLSGTANSITARLQLFQKRLLRTRLLLPPAIHIPVPTGTGTVGSTSEPATYGLKLFE